MQSTYHHHKVEIDENDHPEAYWLAATVNASGAICQRMGIGRKSPNKHINFADYPGIDILGINNEMIRKIMEEVHESFKEILAGAS